MSRFTGMRLILAGLVLSLAMRSESVSACAACFGKSDSPLAEGMNWGIFSLLAVVGCVLSGFAAAGIFLVKKSASVAAAQAQAQEAIDNKV
jgi:hypothetical protein